MTRDGLSIILTALALNAVSLLVAVLYPLQFTYAALIVITLITLFVLWFFRDPDRTFSGDSQAIIAPADGMVVSVTREFESEYMLRDTTRISIFLSVFNVHVNRWPISGKLVHVDYRKGRFVAAFNHKASTENEQSVLAIENAGRVVVFKQIAGLLARRIVYRAEKDQPVSRGERFGMIRFGSRVDIFVDSDVEILVRNKDKVRCGETVIARFS
jgi:phosphatidylserine decarboxylase